MQQSTWPQSYLRSGGQLYKRIIIMSEWELDELEELLEKTKQERDEAISIAKNYRRQNENLMRINKENANAKRGLRPKKEHTGYVVMTSRQRDYRWSKISNGKKIFHEAVIWETTIQTPFTVETDAQTVNIETQRQLFKYEGEGNGLIVRIGITHMEWGPFEKINYTDKNTAFKISFQADYKTGFWEAIIQHTLPLGPVPMEMRMNNN